ncbi:hypothetical protein BaRGS_00007863 [Batillaria attramentaria]|uniref:Uncharacterized protein n=1 Tax=Batillaria attramentaria TaxID=370345 RepID=A0ABD0LP53_9CAEN
MEEKLKERIVFLRRMLNQHFIDTDKLVTIVKRDQLLPPDHVAEIEKQTTSTAKLDRLVDEIVSAKDSAYHKLLHAVEQCRPQPLSPAFAVSLPSYSSRVAAPGPESCSASLTSDSDDDVIRGRNSAVGDIPGKELAGYGKLTNILTTHHYSASSSFPALNDRYSPLPHTDERLHERQSPLEVARKHKSSENRFDWFKLQFEGALNELESLKQQNAEKIGQLSKEAEYFRSMYKRSESMGQQAQEELRTVKTLNVELMATRQQLQEKLAQLEKLREEDKREMAELRSQHHQTLAAMSGSGSESSDVLTDLYDASLEKYEVLKKDYDVLREKYAELAASHSSACCQLEAMADLQKQLAEMRLKRDVAMQDRVAFQQQCTAAFQNLDQTLSENRKIKAALDHLQHEHENCLKDKQQVFTRHRQLQEDCNKAMTERDAAIQEYSQVMSERDTVHKEIEQLQDKLSEKTKLTEKLSKEKAAAEQEIERLQQELTTTASARDKYRQESQGAMETRAQLEAERRDLQREYQLMEQQRDIARKERHQALEQMDILIKETYEKTQKEKAEEMDQVAKETEVLKKQIDKIKHELTDAEQEAMVATKRRDWAFSEIDKTVQERESIRTLCDNLRRDRDRAVSELAKALRNSDECEKQKNDAVKELKELRDKYEVLVERDARRQQLNSVGHNHSRDSAIDADLQELKDGVDGHDLGFELVGGKEDPQFPSDTSLFISHVNKGGAAEGKLRVNDLLLKVNNLDTTSIERRRAIQALRKHSRALTLVVRRRKLSTARIWQPLQLLISCQKEGSIQIEQGLFISAVHPGGVIAKDGMLPSFGDRVISINHQSAENMSAREAMKLLETGTQPIVLDVLRQASPLSSTGSSPTPTTVSVLPPLSDQLSPAQTTAMSKSDTLATHTTMWDSTSADSTRSGGGSSKNLRSSGSQTDSLDSPGPSPPKSLRNHEHDKHAGEDVREKVRDKDRERSRVDREQLSDGGNRNGAVMVSAVTQTPPKGVEDVIVEFPISAFSRTSPDAWGKSRKREYEADSNSGTWPKSRSGSTVVSAVPSTVAMMPAKERPSIKDPFIFEPPQPRNSSGGLFAVDHNSVRHSQQSSDPSMKYPVTVAAPQALLPKPTPHFSVGSATLHAPRVTPKPGVKSQRPTSAPHRVHPGPPGPPWLNSHQLPPHPHQYTAASLSPDAIAAPRPTSLEVPYAIRFGDVPGEDDRVASPAGSLMGSGLSGRSSHSSQYQHPTSPSSSQHSSRTLIMPPRYSSPPGTFAAISPEPELERVMSHNIHALHSASDQYSSPSPSQQSFTGFDRITPTPSEEFGPPRYIRPPPHSGHGRPLSEVELRQAGGYPKHDKHLERFRIPSSSSVTTKSGSVEIVSDRSSPVSPIPYGSNKGKRLSLSSSRDEYLHSPRHHETRTITFEKSSEPVGFQIQPAGGGGIFVSAVNENSLASQAGLVIGDQLLEVCGINMRNASHEHAVTVLRQCGDNLTMKVQYNPEKYLDGLDISSSASIMSSPTHSNKLSSGDSEQSTPKHHTPQRSKSNSSADGTYERPHVVHVKRLKGECGPGFSVTGGNAVGIFVHEIQPDTPAASVLQRGDMILEYNSIVFESITKEQAIIELNKPCSTMRLTLHNNLPNRFFIRTNFTRAAEGEGELDFRKDDILVVESTVHGTLGVWLAWLVDERGNRIRAGSIPSRLRLEDEIVLRRSHSESWSLGDSEELKGSRRGSGSARRSFFRRRRHQRNNSKDSRDLGSFSDASLNSESVPILDDSILGYTQVERIEYDHIRPVVLLAPLAEPLIKKLTGESPDKYKLCEPCIMRAPMTDMEQSLAEGRLVDYWKKDDHFECIQVSLIRDICDKKIHCLLNVNPRAIERLHRLKIYPIVIFVRHKRPKELREIRDAQFLQEKLSNKAAKDSFDHYSKVEQEYGHLFSAVVQGGNLAEMCMHIKTVINSEQKKAIWVTVSSL